ncbi:cytochrome P450 [Solwaraspora sp. WMMD406]|uniref:cytochrome P450 n=1 Tax=Solwaraspora sp. WMMD406 TaxID=3016095 RepID=UPI00241718F1|nr:cytochrome P450 [Solwaraspora sp. WMMD406]MDG4765457.1 cytochrome P450 [Solwaraspora sp. WMMD406]
MAAGWCLERPVRTPSVRTGAGVRPERGFPPGDPRDATPTPGHSGPDPDAARAGLHRSLPVPVSTDRGALPTGARIGVSAWSLQRDPRLYPDPLVFRPTRFAVGTPLADRWLPFAGVTVAASGRSPPSSRSRRCCGRCSPVFTSWPATPARRPRPGDPGPATPARRPRPGDPGPATPARSIMVVPGDGVPAHLR